MYTGGIECRVQRIRIGLRYRIFKLNILGLQMGVKDRLRISFDKLVGWNKVRFACRVLRKDRGICELELG